MMTTQRLLIVLLLICVLLTATFFSIQYTEDHEVVSDDSFLLNVEELVNGSGLLVKQLHIVANGDRSIQVGINDDHSKIVVDADDQTDLMRASVIILADLVTFQDPENNTLTFLVQLKGPGATAGGPSRYSGNRIAQIEDLSDVLEITINDDTYPIGSPIKIGMMQGQPLHLLVQ